ncbi:MAG: zinc metalloprotease, partial [Christensenella sp.]
SIIPRGMAAGYTMTLPEEDKQHVFKSHLMDEITMMLGGRVAESLTLKDISTGAINDLQRATETAKDMVTKYGMSEDLGPVFLASGHEVFLGKDFGQTPEYSENTSARIDAEVSHIIESAYKKAKEILSNNLKKVVDIGEVLMRKEKLTGEEFTHLFDDDIALDDPDSWEIESKEKEPEQIAASEPKEVETKKTIISAPPTPEDA